MYKKTKMFGTSIEVNIGNEGESIEEKIRRIVNNKEPIKDGAPLIYTNRKQGVLAEMDIRSDRWELAVDAMDAVTKSDIAKRDSVNMKVDKKDEATNGTKENL